MTFTRLKADSHSFCHAGLHVQSPSLEGTVGTGERGGGGGGRGILGLRHPRPPLNFSEFLVLL